MFATVDSLVGAPLDGTVVRLAVAAALGLFLGLEREWERKPAGIRTFSLISLLGAVFTVVGRESLLVIGGLLVVVQGVLIAVQGLRTEGEGLALTTSASMLVAYGVGALVAAGSVIEGVTVAVISSLLLVLKRELHSFAWGLSRQEMRSASEFAILAFVVYPLLPAEETVRVGALSLPIEPRVVWLMVVTVAGIGIVNYAIVNLYGGRGIAVTGFFGGLASSTAVVGTVLDHVRQRPEAATYGVAAILLADGAMALRNLAVAVAFTLPDRPLVGVLFPLGAVVLASLGVAALRTDWSAEFPLSLESPFSLRYALGFGAIFLFIVLAGALANAEFGDAGVYVTAAVSGLVSSAGATVSVLVLYRAGSVGQGTAVVAVLLATLSSVVVKAALALVASDRAFAVQVGAWSAVLVAVGGLVAALVV
ncbi:MAG: MgtC/SapB family protein [Halobacteriaceae archaeon]